jgi:hypothetical protein
MLDCEIALFGGDPKVGAISDGQFVHRKRNGLPQRIEVPLIWRRVDAGLWNLIGRNPDYIGRLIEIDHLISSILPRDTEAEDSIEEP